MKPALGLLFLAACVSRHEVARVPSPSGELEAIVIETRAGEGTLPGYEVHLVERGRPLFTSSEVAFVYGARRDGVAWGVELRWRTPRLLAVEYASARDAQLMSRHVNMAGQPIEIGLAPGSPGTR
jgi:hypothetical protein